MRRCVRAHLHTPRTCTRTSYARWPGQRLLHPVRAPLCTRRKRTTEGEAGQRLWVPGGGEGQRQSRAGASSFSASASPGFASGPGGSVSVLPTALPWSLPLCRFCLRVSLYRKVMSLEAGGLCHCQSGQDPGARDPGRDSLWPAEATGPLLRGGALTAGRSATPSTSALARSRVSSIGRCRRAGTA